jgi:hypothetical protein
MSMSDVVFESSVPAFVSLVGFGEPELNDMEVMIAMITKTATTA